MLQTKIEDTTGVVNVPLYHPSPTNSGLNKLHLESTHVGPLPPHPTCLRRVPTLTEWEVGYQTRRRVFASVPLDLSPKRGPSRVLVGSRISL